jgi:outer membrane protein OmpA-like peptidoglycan-associated protein
MYSPKGFSRHFAIGLFLCSIVGLSSGCVASRKFVRGEVHTTADELNARIDKTDGNLKEMNDRVGNLDARSNEHGRRLDSLNGDLQKTNTDLQKTTGDLLKTSERTSQAQATAQNAQAMADQTNGRVVTLEENFQNRNQYTVAAEKYVTFRFDSADLDRAYTSSLDEVAQITNANPDALIVLEGRTDSMGDDTYNIQLGERRAEAVKRYLVVEKSVSMYRIHQTSFGAARPIADNKSRQGREKNRVVAVSVLVPRSVAKSAANPQK